MDITQQKVDDLNAVLKVKVMPNDYQEKVENALKDYRKKVNLPGFRPGKVPTGLIKQKYGTSILVDEINKLLSEEIQKYIVDNKIEVLGNPLPKNDDVNIDWDSQKEFEFSYDLGLAPQFDLKLSSKEKFQYKKIKIDDKMLGNYLEDISKRYGKMVAPDEVGEKDMLFGDFVELDDKGEIKEGGIFHSASVALDRVDDEQAKKEFIGKKKEDKFVVNPHKISKNTTDLAAMLGIQKGQAENMKASFSFKITNISRIEPAELNQELFDKVYGKDQVKSLEEFKEKIREEIAKQFIQESENKLRNDIIEKLIEKFKLKLPDDFLKRWLIAANEKPLTMEQIEGEYEQYAKNLKWQLIENKVIKENDIKVDNEEVVAHTKELIKQQFAQYGRPNPAEQELEDTAKRVLENQEELRKIYDVIYNQKVMQLFKDTFKIEDKEVSIDDFYKS